MENFVYKNPTKLIFGRDNTKHIGKEIRKNGVNRVLLLYGGGSIFKNGVYETVAKSLNENRIEFVELGGIKPNPRLSKVYEAIEICKREKLQGILAVGGGSVIDTSKTVAAGVMYEGDIWDVFEGRGQVKDALPIFTVLTISATGSEMNAGAVITKEDEKKKWSFGSPHVYPKASIIDPEIQFTLPENQTVNGAVDAISHVFELYFDGTKGTDIQDELSEGIIRTVMKHVRVLIDEPQNYDSRAQLCLSATLALNGINGIGRSGGDWSSHQIEHSISAFFDIAHGAGLAIVFPAWMKYVYRDDIDKFQRFAEVIFNIKEGKAGEKIEKAIEELKSFYKSIGAPTTLKEAGIKEEELERIADNAGLSTPMGTLRKLYRNDILEILKIAYE